MKPYVHLKRPTLVVSSKPYQSAQTSKTSEHAQVYIYIYIIPYIRDTADFIQRIKVLGKLPVECYLVTLDVSSLYTNIDVGEGLTVVKEELMKTNRVKPSLQTLTCLLEKVLRLNSFTFNDEHFIQIKGTGMGTRIAPNFANVYKERFETLHTKQSGPATL